ncbi:alpha/beta hydrolase [Robbsia sp. KACC 23696]|uniref:alpha/beta hydrolase n=1 Tax=Robbsia sp. KACC 23696 TaxID=3149231 RepID=UPI00325B7B66
MTHFEDDSRHHGGEQDDGGLHEDAIPPSSAGAAAGSPSQGSGEKHAGNRPDAMRRAWVGRAMLGVPLTLAGGGWASRAVAGVPEAAETEAPKPIAAPGDVIDVPLWPEGRVPGVRDTARVAAIGAERVSAGGAIRNVSQPRLRIYPADPSRRTGMAILVIAGGGYAHIECGHESTPTCRWLQSLGITACELIYRLPREGWDRTAPLQDGQRAMRVIRAHAQTLHIEPARLAVMGFSAGGHLAGMTAVTPDVARYAPLDAIDALASDAAFAALLYPVLTLVPPFDNTHTRRSLLGRDNSGDDANAAAAALSVDRQVNEATPPVFLAQATDDPISPVDNSLLMYSAMRSAGRPVDLHLFQSGGHGWGLGRPGTEQTLWPALFQRWMGLLGG